MSRHRVARQFQAGSVILAVVLSALLLVAGYFGYRAYAFYSQNVAPVVASVTKVVGGLNPYTVTNDRAEIATWLKSSFRIDPPQGYVGAFGLNIALLGQQQFQLMALIPKDAKPSDIFEGGRNEIRFNPGASTIFLAAQASQINRDEMRDAIAKMVGGKGQSEPMKEVFIEAGGRKVAAYRGATESHGAWNTVVFVFLDEGRLLFAAGPQDRFNEAALVATLASVVATHPANALLYQHVKAEAAVAAPRADPCGIQGLDGDFEIVVISVHKGSKPLDLTIDTRAGDVTQEEVVVGTTPKPVVLILMGYDPIVWNIGQTEGARIAGVLAHGYYRQAVIGLPKDTPLTMYSGFDGPNACQSVRASSPGGNQYVVAERRIRELFGRGIGTFMNQKGGARFVVGTVTGDVIHSPDVTLKSIALPDSVMPGGARGLERLVKEQSIRHATDEEVERWLQGSAQRKGMTLEAIKREMNWRLGNDHVYVVLNSFDLPDGLGGANARTFILPAGTERPGGPQGHNTFLQMDGYQCYGVGCR